MPTTHLGDGAWHLCAIKYDGTLHGCGTNYNYALGDLVALDATLSTLTQIGSTNSWVWVSNGAYHTAAIQEDGTLWTMGKNGSGECGQGTTSDIAVLTKVGVATDWAKVYCGGPVTVAIKADGTLWICGDLTYFGGSSSQTTFTQVGSATNWVTATCSYNSIGAINTSGELYTAGSNDYGELGHNDTTPRSALTKVGVETDWAEVHSASIYIAARKTTGILYGAGFNKGVSGIGFIGQGTAVSVDEFTAMSGDTFTSVSVGVGTVGLKSTGVPMVTGDNADGALGTGDTVNADTLVVSDTAPPGVTLVMQGDANTYCVAGGKLYAVGYGGEGALGEGTTTTVTSYVDTGFYVIAPTFEDIEQTCAVISDATFSWGSSFIESVSATDSLVNQAVSWLLDSIRAVEAVSPKTNTVFSYSDSAVANDLITAAMSLIVADITTASESQIVGSAANLVSVLVATGAASTQTSAVFAVSEVVTALDAFNRGLLEQMYDGASTTEAISTLYTSVLEAVSSAVMQDVVSNHVSVYAAASNSLTSSEVTSLNQLINLLIEDNASSVIHLSIGGEVYTGWVMNTSTMASSEYQGLKFNSLCRLDNRYFGASASGIHELSGSTDDGVDIATYIQSGLMDFGSNQQKAIPDAYLAVDIDGRIALGVTVSEKKDATQFWYEVSADQVAVNNLKLPIGRGLRGRYWKFDIASESLSDFESLTLLPVVLTRRV